MLHCFPSVYMHVYTYELRPYVLVYHPINVASMVTSSARLGSDARLTIYTTRPSQPPWARRSGAATPLEKIQKAQTPYNSSHANP